MFKKNIDRLTYACPLIISRRFSIVLTLSMVSGLPQRRAGIRVLDLGLDVVDGYGCNG
jgi:hypothetical protein